ncbi:MAG: GNAT family N-acetyltransferase [Fluviicola sp.]|nr:GNAT family N-acetyltransferase [Fluviicola sp.]
MKEFSIYLRYVEAKDAALILDWENNEENWAVSENDSPYSLFDIHVLIGELQDIPNAKQARWMICLSENDEAIGNIDLTEIDFKKKEATVGILVACKEYRQKGIASKSLQLIEDESIRLGVEKFICSVHKDNLASCQLFLKNNFRKIGEKKEPNSSEDEYIDVLLFEKWLKK